MSYKHFQNVFGRAAQTKKISFASRQRILPSLWAPGLAGAADDSEKNEHIVVVAIEKHSSRSSSKSPTPEVAQAVLAALRDVPAHRVESALQLLLPLVLHAPPKARRAAATHTI